MEEWGTGAQLNVVLYTSGFGDGHYASYQGFDEGGEAVSLVTDFMIVEDFMSPDSP